MKVYRNDFKADKKIKQPKAAEIVKKTIRDIEI